MSLISSDNVDETPQMISQDISQFSVTKNDTVASTIEKLRQRCIIFQNRRTTSLRQYEESEKRLSGLRQATEEAEQRNQKLTKKISYYKENLQAQIQKGLQEQQERVVDLQQQLNISKHRSQELEDNRKNLVETNFITRNQYENQIQNLSTQRDVIRQQLQRAQQSCEELDSIKNSHHGKLQSLLDGNHKALDEYHAIILGSAHCTDENYANYVKQIVQAKQLSNPAQNDFLTQLQKVTNMDPSMITKIGHQMSMLQNTQLPTQLLTQNMTTSQRNETLTNFLVDKCQYGTEWTRDIQRPKTEQTVQVNTPARNMNASITIFDEDTGDNYTFTQQVQENTPVIKRPRDSYFSAQDQKSTTIHTRRARNEAEVRVDSSDRPSVSFNTGEKKSLKSKTVQAKDNYEAKLYRNKAKLLAEKQDALQKRLKTQSRDDIIIGLEEKIQDAVEKKTALQRRLDAINRSYSNTADKQIRMNKIRTEITSKMVEIKMLKDRLKKVKNML